MSRRARAVAGVPMMLGITVVAFISGAISYACYCANRGLAKLIDGIAAWVDRGRA